MEKITLCAVLSLCVVFAVAFTAKDLTVLLERAEDLLARSHKIVAEHKNASRGHLLSNVDTEMTFLEWTIREMKKLDLNNTRQHELNILEETLLVHENRIQEELEFVEEVYRNFKPSGKSANELLEFSEKLLKEAKAELAKHQGHGHEETKSIEEEIKTIETQIKQIQDPKVTAAKLEMLEMSLAYHEKSLYNLYLRIQQD